MVGQPESWQEMQVLQEFHNFGGDRPRLNALKSVAIAAIIGTFLTLGSCAPSPSSERLDRKTLAQAEAILEDITRTELALSPETASRVGLLDAADPGTHAHLDDHSQAGFERRRLIRLDLLNLARSRPRMPADHPLARDLRIFEDALFRLTQVQSIGHGRVSLHAVRPYAVDPFSSVWIEGPSLLERDHYVTERDDAMAYLARLEALPGAIDDIRRRFIADAEAGLIPPAALVRETQTVIARLIETDPAKLDRLSDVYANILQSMSDLDLEEARRLSKRAEQAVELQVIPAYSRLAETLAEFQSQAPAQGGLWAQPDGHNTYRKLLAWHIDGATDLEVLHQTNLDEAENRKNTFQDALTSAQSETASAQPDLSTIERLAQLNADEPTDTAFQPAIPTNTASTAIATSLEPFIVEGYQYRPARLDGLRPAVVALQEAQVAQWPRHIQDALFTKADLLRRAPYAEMIRESSARKALAPYPSFYEGWQIYTTETQADELWSRQHQLLGNQQLHLFYVALATIDTGIHEKRWSLDQATDYLAETAFIPHPLSRQAVLDVTARPGYAAARVMSYRRLKALSTRARAVLGNRYTETEFHNVLLADGPRPFSMIEQDVENWYQALISTEE